jgi:hypothetical protein
MISKQVEDGLGREGGKRHKIQWSVLLPKSKDMMMRSKQNILASASSCALPRENTSLQQPGTARTSCSPSVEEDVFYDTRSSVSLQQLLLRSELEDEVSSKFSPSLNERFFRALQYYWLHLNFICHTHIPSSPLQLTDKKLGKDVHHAGVGSA